MCGIVACVDGDGRAVGPLLDGLAHLEYRGYDSAGVAFGTGADRTVVKREGEIDRLRASVDESRRATVGVAHTRWSTHGQPTVANAHPHTDCTGRVAVVHNGIVDNHRTLREELVAAGHEFTSDTDTEVIPHLIEAESAAGAAPERAFRAAVERLSGSYAVAALVGDDPVVHATREGSPLVGGLDADRWFLASDVPAFLRYTDRVTQVEDGEFVRLAPGGVEIETADGRPVSRAPETVDWDPESVGRGGYDHYMAKEIHEQPAALRRTVRGRVDARSVSLAGLDADRLRGVDAVHLVGMGTSSHAASYAECLLNRAGLPARAWLASVYRTVAPPVDDGTLVVAVTQSGETADTLSALRRAADAGARTLALTNVVGSTATREADATLPIRAGPEIGVAATKTFSSQVAALTALTEWLVDPGPGDARRRESLAALPDHVQEVLDTSRAEAVARRYHDADAYFFVGRWVGAPVALEGALKFKEITYEHAEGFAGAELKHGPLALVTPETPVFAVATGAEPEATVATVREVQARDAPVVAVASRDDTAVANVADETLLVPPAHPDVTGVLANVQLQLLAYHAARRLGRDIDKPRNLAKSVTVE